MVIVSLEVVGLNENKVKVTDDTAKMFCECVSGLWGLELRSGDSILSTSTVVASITGAAMSVTTMRCNAVI